MATQNLIEIQSNLQDPATVKMQDLINYANGSNPEVPSFLALIELNRRKQIEQTAKAFNGQGEQGTIKDQTVNALMGRQQVNPAAPPPGINPVASPQIVNPAAAPRQAMPGQAPQQVDPTAAPPMQAAEGGLMSIPVKHFKQQNFAGGGIVALAGGGDAEDEGQEMPERRKTYKLGDQELTAPRSVEEIQRGLPSIAPMQGARPGDQTPEQAYQRQQEIKKLAGVSEDPYADVKKRQSDMESRQAEQRKGDAVDRLLAMGEAFATADPSKGFGFAAASGSKASRALESEQRAIRDKQDALNMDIAKNMAKEEDARRRGDAAGVESALDKIKKDQAAYDQLQMKRDELTNSQFKTASDIRTGDIAANKLPLDIYAAQTQRGQADALAQHYKNADELAALTKPSADDITYSRIMGKVNQDPEIKMLAKKLENYEPTDVEYAQIQKMMYNKMKSYFARHPGLLPPEAEQDMSLEPTKKKKSFEESFKEMAGQGWYPGKNKGSPAQPAATTIPKGWSVQQNP
jgi:hypothetical protein